MDCAVDIARGHGAVNEAGEESDAAGKQILEKCPDHIERQEKYESHDRDEHRNGSVSAGQDAVELLAAQVLLALVRFRDALVADLMDVGKAHVSDGSAAIQPALLLHLEDNVL